MEQNKKKKLLIFAHYYAPDVASTGQILKEQAEGMKDEFDVTVICVVPSYSGKVAPEYQIQTFYYEEMNGVHLIRVRVPEFSKENKISRVKNILAYFFRALEACRRAGKQDYIFTISQPPIIGGILGVFGKYYNRIRYHCKTKMIYCIQDFNPEQVMAVNYTRNKLILGIMMLLDKFSCRCSDLVITVGRDLVDTLKNRFHNKNVPNHVLINNWIDEKAVYPLNPDHAKIVDFKEKYDLQNKFVIAYSGNIGLYYDLENIIKVIRKFKPGTKAVDGKEVVFAFIGAGSVLEKLKLYVENNHMDNVRFIPYQDKEDLIYSLNAADVHWCVNAKGIKGVSCPSKYYGIAACAKPVLAVLESESEIRMIIEETNGGLVCEPGEYKAIAKNIQWFLDNSGSKEMDEMGQRSYSYLSKNLTKDVSITKYIEAIRKL